MPRHLLRLLLLFVFSSGCSSDVSSPLYRVELIAADGSDPTAAGYTSLAVELYAAGVYSDEVFDFSGLEQAVTLPESASTVELRLGLSGAAEAPDLVGAPPDFYLGETGGLLRVPMVAPESCTSVSGWTVATSAPGTGWARSGTFVVGFGGDATDRVAYLDLLRVESSELADPAPFAGAVQLASLGESAALVVGDAGAFRYDLGVASGRATSLTLHAGAGVRSAFAAYSDGAIVAGGSESAGLSVVDILGGVLALSLPGARVDAGAIVFDGYAVVVGGDSGAVDVVALEDGAGSRVETSDGVRRAPLVVSLGEELLVLGGLDDEGNVRSDTLLLSGCPTNCTASAGPSWASARPGVRVVSDAADTARVLLVGDDRVEALTVGLSGVTFSELYTLDPPRRDPGAWLLESGILLVTGGEDREGAALGDSILCAPSPLRAAGGGSSD